MLFEQAMNLLYPEQFELIEHAGDERYGGKEDAYLKIRADADRVLEHDPERIKAAVEFVKGAVSLRAYEIIEQQQVPAVMGFAGANESH